MLLRQVSLFCFIFLFSCQNSTEIDNKLNEHSEQRMNKEFIDKEYFSSDAVIPIEGKIIGYKIIQENGNGRKIPIYDKGARIDLGDKSIDCKYKRVYVDGEVDHFKEKSGKWLGLWDGYNKIGYQNSRTKWGFTKYFVSSENVRTSAINAGYNPDNIMAAVFTNNFSYWFTPGTYKAYHLDEVFERGSLSRSQVVSMANTLDMYYDHAKLFLSSYKIRNDVYDKVDDYQYVLNNTLNTYLMCDQYYDGSIWYGNDQRPYWNKFNDYYGCRVLSHWLSLDIDGSQGDFQRLFWKANDLDIDELWLFVGNSVNVPSYLYTLGEAGFNAGWLRKYVKKYSYWYVCPSEFGDPCYCSETDSGWILDVIIYEGAYEEY